MKVVWLTGLPCSGKTTIATEVSLRLQRRGLNVDVLDGDEVRKRYPTLGFSKEDRLTHAWRLCGFVKASLADVVLVAAVSPYRESRDHARSLFHPNFIEVHVDCQQLECERRDVKGLWSAARAGTLQNLTGMGDPYEAPLDAEVTLRTDWETVEESVLKLEAYICATISPSEKESP